MTDNPPAGIHPLRERLTGLFKYHCQTLRIDLTSLQDLQGDVLDTFVDWLREEAAVNLLAKAVVDELDRQEANDDHLSVGWYVARAGVSVLADAIYPKEAHDGQ